jgi:hypothetical protein
MKMSRFFLAKFFFAISVAGAQYSDEAGALQISPSTLFPFFYAPVGSSHTANVSQGEAKTLVKNICALKSAPPTVSSNKGRIAIVLRGDTFQNDWMHEPRSFCCETGLQTQLMVFKSQMAMFASLEEEGYSVDVFGRTFKCGDDSALATAVSAASDAASSAPKLPLETLLDIWYQPWLEKGSFETIRRADAADEWSVQRSAAFSFWRAAAAYGSSVEEMDENHPYDFVIDMRW